MASSLLNQAAVERITHHPSGKNTTTIARVRCFAVVLLLSFLFLTAIGINHALAQETDRNPESPILKQLVTDPTTYAPAGILYTAMRLDWNTSQPFFQHGFVEDNPRYTKTGLPHDTPISYADGNRQILKRSLGILPMSVANNLTARFVERRLRETFPEHRKLWTTLSWIERAAFSSYVSYQFSGVHFEQWQKNKERAAQLGY